MSDHGILMSAPMVRAIIEGRKSQTRRVVTRNNSTVLGHNARGKDWAQWWADARWDQAVPTRHTAEALHVACGGPDAHGGAIYRVRPVWQPGDRLWVRETWCGVPDEMGTDFDEYIYRADLTGQQRVDELAVRCIAPTMLARWRPAIHMPRRASRITLRVTQARGEHLQDISGEDATNEGIVIPRCNCEVCRRTTQMRPADAGAAVMEYSELWDSINAQRPGCAWADNPWVWVITFARAAQ